MTGTGPQTRTATACTALCGLVVIGPLTLAIFIPTLPAVQAEFGADIQVVQLTLSLPLLSVVLVPLLAGTTSDRVGRRPILLASLGVLILGSVGCYLAPDIWTLVIGRMVVGVASSACLIVGRAVVNDFYGKEVLARAMANYTVAPVAALLIAPTIGGFLTDGYGWRSVFIFLGGAALLVAVVTALFMPETKESGPASEARAGGELGSLLRSAEFWGFTFFSVFHFAVAVGFIAAAPYLMVNLLHRTAAEYGLGLVFVIAGMLAGVAVASRLPTRFGIATVVLAGAAFALVAGLLLPGSLAMWGLSPLDLFGSTALVAFGIGFAMPAGQAGIVGMIPELAGTASGISGFLQMLFAAGFAHLVALPWERPDWALAMIATGGLAAAVLAALIPVRKAAERRKA